MTLLRGSSSNVQRCGSITGISALGGGGGGNNVLPRISTSSTPKQHAVSCSIDREGGGVVGRCRLIVSKPVVKARTVSATSA